MSGIPDHVSPPLLEPGWLDRFLAGLPDWIVRAFWAAACAAGAIEVANAANLFAGSTLRAAALAAIAAGISAGKSGAIAWWKSHRPVAEPPNAKGSASP